ncbi:hypothetical protein SAMN05428942_7265 [Streptomyces sp. 2112.2]|uniref:hypothetical protein n=1 Tax=Streptomyces sp. 2112.2 TaxID=1881024 RepID=UPI0008987886|nr:hypothetical protein [Streptomyces sp. 2112.2]SEF16405.1 hypothetical protein SAMN05428942_7265 [Streptomyces sp. 2112.2]
MSVETGPGGVLVPVLTPGGFQISAAAARLAEQGTPASTRRNRRSRADLYAAWCRAHGRIGTDPGVLVDYTAALVARRHPAETITSYLATLIHLRAVSGHPVRPDERDLIQRVINARSIEEATDPAGEGDALQVTECTRDDLRAMLATLDRSTVEGIRAALALTLAWYLGARACEVPALALRDVNEVSAHYRDPATGRRVQRPGLLVIIRRSKTNPYGRKVDRVRLLAQDDETCPVAALRAWVGVLVEQSADTDGPLLRRVKRGRLSTAGRPPKDPRRAGGVGDRWMRNLIAAAAAAADLTRELAPDERRLLSTRDEQRELAAAADAAEREAIRVRRRLARRALRRQLDRYAGQSMRRGQNRHQARRRVPQHITEMHLRYVPGSRAAARYREDLVDWDDNPTIPAG